MRAYGASNKLYFLSSWVVLEFHIASACGPKLQNDRVTKVWFEANFIAYIRQSIFDPIGDINIGCYLQLYYSTPITENQIDNYIGQKSLNIISQFKNHGSTYVSNSKRRYSFKNVFCATVPKHI